MPPYDPDLYRRGPKPSPWPIIVGTALCMGLITFGFFLWVV